MDRLTERFSNGQVASYWCGSNCKYDHKYCCENLENCPAMEDILEKLAHYEDLEEAGMAIEALKEQERKWIPVSERLPEKDGYYFVTKRLIDGRIQTDIEPFWTGADWWKSEFHFAGIGLWEVLAWQPLPEPYKAGEQE